MHHPDIRYEATRRQYAELLEQARLERLAALADENPELGARFARARGVLTSLQLRVEPRPVQVHRTRLNPAS